MPSHDAGAAGTCSCTEHNVAQAVVMEETEENTYLDCYLAALKQ